MENCLCISYEGIVHVVDTRLADESLPLGTFDRGQATFADSPRPLPESLEHALYVEFFRHGAMLTKSSPAEPGYHFARPTLEMAVN